MQQIKIGRVAHDWRPAWTANVPAHMAQSDSHSNLPTTTTPIRPEIVGLELVLVKY
jgi:hypothetical protein